MTQYTTPDDAFTRELQRINALIAWGQLQEAAHALNQAQRVNAQDERVFLIGMRLADKAGNAAGARTAVERALKLAPDSTVALMEAALLHARHGRKDDAMALARRAMGIAPDDYEVVRRAAAVSIQAGDLKAGTEWMRKVVKFRPHERGFRQTLANHLLLTGEHAEAMDLYNGLLAESPEDMEALSTRVQAAIALGDLECARQDTETLLQLDPSNPAHAYWHAVARGKQPPTQPPSMVTQLFDASASTFDDMLWRRLQYRLPQQVADRLLALYPDRRFNVLDLGCGTGLLGVFLGPIDGHIIGVDLSEEMIRQAARHNVYSRFHLVNAADALRETPSEHYEVITALDVLVYVGDLTEAVPNALRILKPGGHFMFSCETANEDEADVVLRKSNRFAHKASHVERLCRDAGFTEVTVEHFPTLRMEAGVPVPGFLVTARKAA